MNAPHDAGETTTDRGLDRRTALLRLGGTALGLAAVARVPRSASAHNPNDFYQGALPYDFSALEGFLSAESVEAHYRHHHRPLVDGANEILRSMARARAAGQYDLLPGLDRRFIDLVCGHALHSVFWQSLSPYAGGDPTGDVASHLEQHFGSIEAFRGQFAATAKAIDGAGWTLAAWEPVSSRMIVHNVSGNSGPLLVGATPLLALDLHEHAYAPDYGHRRNDYIDKFFDVLNWDFLALQLKKAH